MMLPQLRKAYGAPDSSTSKPASHSLSAYIVSLFAICVFHRHLDRIPTDRGRADFIGRLSEQAAADDPPFSLDYWRLNLRGSAM